MPLTRALCSILAVLALGCTPGVLDDAGTDADRDAGPPSCAPSDPPRCAGDLLVSCVADGGLLQRDCTAEGLRCSPELGCTSCVPGAIECEDGVQVLRCRDDGTGFETAERCDTAADLVCADGRGCLPSAELCGVAEIDRSYLGCEYWPTVTLNHLLGVSDPSAPPDLAEFRFAIAVANPQPVPAEVEVLRDGLVVASVTIAPESTETLELDWVEALRAPPGTGSIWVRSGAYQLTSSVPISAFQFNALQYRIDTEPPRFSYSNDASLLFPARSALCSPLRPCRFVAITATPLPIAPSFVSITATGEAISNVTVTPTASVRASVGGDVAVPAIDAGETVTFALERGDVLSLAAASGDMSGTVVLADAPVSVISGNSCANVPSNTVTACDHIEESLPPVAAWGTRYLVRRTRPAVDEPNHLRIVAAVNDTEVRYGDARTPDLLQAGEVISFPLRRDSLSIIANRPILVAQFLVGQSYSELAGEPPAPYGDPSMSIVAPAVQFRRGYVFLTPDTYDRNSVAIVSREGAVVVLDGEEVTMTSEDGIASADVAIAPGYHVIRGDQPLGIQVYSLADFTSYMYPGGLNLFEVSILE